MAQPPGAPHECANDGLADEGVLAFSNLKFFPSPLNARGLHALRALLAERVVERARQAGEGSGGLRDCVVSFSFARLGAQARPMTAPDGSVAAGTRGANASSFAAAAAQQQPPVCENGSNVAYP